MHGEGKEQSDFVGIFPPEASQLRVGDLSRGGK